jgi:hypothetical protein
VRGQNLNSKLQVACVGVNGMGFTDLKNVGTHAAVKLVGFCDVDANRFDQADKAHPGVKHFSDYREMFSMLGDGFDAVTVGIPDHMHAPVAVAAMQATEFVGLPECQLPLSQAVTYLALAPKSNACTTAIAAARQDVRDRGVIPVPRHLQDRHSAAAKAFGRGEGYRYAHDHPDGIAAQDYLGVEKRYYEPTDRGEERDLALRLEEIRRRLAGG